MNAKLMLLAFLFGQAPDPSIVWHDVTTVIPPLNGAWYVYEGNNILDAPGEEV